MKQLPSFQSIMKDLKEFAPKLRAPRRFKPKKVFEPRQDTTGMSMQDRIDLIRKGGSTGFGN